MSVFLSNLSGAQWTWMGFPWFWTGSWDAWKASRGHATMDQSSRLAVKSCQVSLRQAKLSSWLHSFSIVTETRSRLCLCSYRCSATKRNPKRSFLSPTLWFVELFPKYALGMSTLKMLLCSFLGLVQDRIFADSSTKCWCLTVFEMCWIFFLLKFREAMLGRPMYLLQEYQ